MTATVILTGLCCGSRRAVWTVGITLSVFALLAQLSRYFGGWQVIWSLTDGPVLTLRLAQWSAMTVAIWTVAAYVAGKVELIRNRRNQYWLAIAIFTAFELSSLLRTGTFLAPYLSGHIAGFRINIFSSVAKLLGPWLIVSLLGIAIKATPSRWFRLIPSLFAMILIGLALNVSTIVSNKEKKPEALQVPPAAKIPATEDTPPAEKAPPDKAK